MNPKTIFDGHNDALLSVNEIVPSETRSFYERSERGHVDLPRARQGGLKGGIFAVFISPPPDSSDTDPFSKIIRKPDGFEVPPIPPIDPAYAEKATNEVIDRLPAFLEKGQGQVGLVRTYGDLQDYLARDVLALVLHLEGAEAIHPNLDNLEHFYQRGVRSIGLVWSRPNAFGNGVHFRFPSTPDTGEGLTPAGKALIRACDQMGILVDLAHLNEKGFWDAAETTTQPLVVSHTAAYSISRSSRNLLDSQIDAVGQSGGLIGLMFQPSEVRADGAHEKDTPLSAYVAAIQYVAGRIGVDHISLGGDFDGALMPNDLSDAAALPNLVAALQAAGIDGEDLDKVLYKNWQRILKNTLKG